MDPDTLGKWAEFGVVGLACGSALAMVFYVVTRQLARLEQMAAEHAAERHQWHEQAVLERREERAATVANIERLTTADRESTLRIETAISKNGDRTEAVVKELKDAILELGRQGRGPL